MKRIILTTIALLLLPVLVFAAGMGQSAGHDLDVLWALAQQQFDLDQEDAVVLLESRQIAFTHDGALQTRVHRVVWVGTTVGIRGYADLRVPWNSATSTLDVEILRTWREGRWWPDAEKISDTAVVHTLPYAVDKADDYTDMRETMLLHDGVELGCIMETAYTITEGGVPAGGGVFVLPQRDPVVLCQLRIMTPPGLSIQHVELNGAVVPESVNPTKGQGLLWSGNHLPALKLPLTTGPEAYEPAIAWSTWTEWSALGDHWNQAFAAAKALDPDQVDQMRKKINPAMSDLQKLKAVGEHLNEMTRPVHYDTRFWRFAPRPASRTLATAYGHDLDRAVLAAALLEAAGLEANPMLVGSGKAWPLEAAGISRLQGLDRVVLGVKGMENLLLDSADGRLLGQDEVFGKPVYQIGYLPHFGASYRVPPNPDPSFTAGLVLTAGEEGQWQGEGYFRGQALFSGLGRVVAGSDLMTGPLGDLVGSLLPSAELTAAVPARLERAGVFEASFSLALASPEKDAFDRNAIVLGRPLGGLLDRLPHDVHLYEESRQTPVLGVGGWEQSLTLRLEVAEDQLLQAPEAVSLTNAAGSFTLTSDYDDGWLTLTRAVKLVDGQEGDLPAELWPDLRALLLEEADPVHGTVLLK
jgi:hypothetical protein